METTEPSFSQYGISEEEGDKLVAEVIRYILFKTHQNSGCPIKRDELTQLITKNYNNRQLPSQVLNKATTKLSTIFGYDMKELQRVRPSSTNQARSSQSSADSKSYIITSQLDPRVYRKHVDDPKKSHLNGLTFVVIGIVNLAGGKITEESLWHHLARLGLSQDDEKNTDFGSTKQALETLVQQRYLQKDKSNGPEGLTLYYELAERGLQAIASAGFKESVTQNRSWESGSSEATLIKGGMLYRHKSFLDLPSWEVARHHSKWESIALVDTDDPTTPKSKRSQKKTKTSESGNYTTLTDGLSSNMPEMNSNEDPEEDSAPTRPQRKKNGKLSSKGKETVAESIFEYISAKLVEMAETKERKEKEVASKIKRDEAYIKYLAEIQKNKDLNVILQPHDNLDEPFRSILLQRKHEICEKWGWPMP